MPYTTPPTFADGNILTASQLNILSADVEFLYGQTPAVNPGFQTHDYSTGLIENQKSWYFRYQGWNYLWYKIHRNGTFTNDMQITINGNNTVLTGSTSSINVVFEDAVNMAGYGLTVGNYYELHFGGNFSSGSVRVHYIFVSPTDPFP
jgi:hypothetical protein